jgi:hypothetical protein
MPLKLTYTIFFDDDQGRPDLRDRAQRRCDQMVPRKLPQGGPPQPRHHLSIVKLPADFRNGMIP